MTLDPDGPWTVDTRDLARRPGISRAVRRTVTATQSWGVPEVIEVPVGAEFDVDVLLESVVEGVLVSGSVSVGTTGACSRCLDPLADEITVELTELFAYPDSTTEATTEEDEVSRMEGDLIDLEPLVRDAVVLALPAVPLCEENCRGLCSECGRKWADLEPGHGHETIDPRWAALVERFGDAPAGGQDPEA